MAEIKKFDVTIPYKKTLEMKVWNRIFQIELKRIQEILYPYLRWKYPDYFQYHILDIKAIRSGEIKVIKFEKKITKYHLLINFALENDSNELFDYEGCLSFMETDESCYCDTAGYFPTSFCNFVWELGISPSWIRKLYQLPDAIYSRSKMQGPYEFEEIIKQRRQIAFNHGPILKDLILRYFESEEAYTKFVDSIE